jgi:hypothetical protein
MLMAAIKIFRFPFQKNEVLFNTLPFFYADMKIERSSDDPALF